MTKPVMEYKEAKILGKVAPIERRKEREMQRMSVRFCFSFCTMTH